MFDHIMIITDSVTAIIGPSGSGKTAFLSAVLGEIPDVSGDIQWDK